MILTLIFLKQFDIDTYKKDYNKYKEELKRLTPTIENKASDAIMQLMNEIFPSYIKSSHAKINKRSGKVLLKKYISLIRIMKIMRFFLINLCTKQGMPLGTSILVH